METSSIISILSILATITMGVMTVIVMTKYRPTVSSNVEKNFSKISIHILNKGQRPINIKSFVVGYGQIQSDLQIILTEKLEKPLKILDGEEYEYQISRDKIIELTKINAIKQYYSQRLWTGIILTNGKSAFRQTKICSPFMGKEKNYPSNAEDFILADKFIGFEQMEWKCNEEPIMIK